MGDVLTSLKSNGYAETTNIAYISDHGDNMGARGLWGKGVMFEESVGVPMMIAGPDAPSGKVVETPVSLIDMFPTILAGAGVENSVENSDSLPGRSLFDVAAEADDDSRLVFSEYHGAAAKSGAFMLRDGRYKYIHYVDYEPELYDLDNDPEELSNVAAEPEFQNVVADFEERLRSMLEPEAVNAQALADQAALIERHGGLDKVLDRGGIAGTPTPGGPSTTMSVR